MSDSNSLMNIGDLAKPATTLIEKIADATGAVFLPYQIKRVAKAEAEAEKTKALASIEITEIQQRAMLRMINEETKKQENIENITAKALPELTEDSKPEEIENDWLSHFFDKCKLISDEQMQEIWARILAGKANKSGKFSKRTVELLATFEKEDAEIFSKLCSFVWSIDTLPNLFIYDSDDLIYRENGINFYNLQHLETIGLIRFKDEGFMLENQLNNTVADYSEKRIFIDFEENNNTFVLGQCILTSAGEELIQAVEITGSDKIFEHTIEIWKEKGYKVFSFIR